MTYIFYVCSEECKNFKEILVKFFKIQTQGLRLWPQKTNMLKGLGIKSLSPTENTLGIFEDVKDMKETLSMSGLSKACCPFNHLC